MKGGLPVDHVLDGSSQEIHLAPPETARRRAYGDFRFRLGLARDSINAIGTRQYIGRCPQARMFPAHGWCVAAWQTRTAGAFSSRDDTDLRRLRCCRPCRGTRRDAASTMRALRRGT